MLLVCALIVGIALSGTALNAQNTAFLGIPWLDLGPIIAPPPPSAEPPPPGYEPVGPGDRLYAGKPGLDRQLLGQVTGGPGEFGSICTFNHSKPDDPIVFPGQPGASHLHDFFGNAGTNANSTDDSLRGGQTTCNIRGDTASYWAPAVYVNGAYKMPQGVIAYYRTGGKDYKSIQPFPRGLKYVLKDTSRVTYECLNGSGVGGRYKTLPNCPSDTTAFVIEYEFPDCWDGKWLDTPDHQLHMTYASAGQHPYGGGSARPRTRCWYHACSSRSATPACTGGRT